LSPATQTIRCSIIEQSSDIAGDFGLLMHFEAKQAALFLQRVQLVDEIRRRPQSNPSPCSFAGMRDGFAISFQQCDPPRRTCRTEEANPHLLTHLLARLRPNEGGPVPSQVDEQASSTAQGTVSVNRIGVCKSVSGDVDRRTQPLVASGEAPSGRKRVVVKHQVGGSLRGVRSKVEPPFGTARDSRQPTGQARQVRVHARLIRGGVSPNWRKSLV